MPVARLMKIWLVNVGKKEEKKVDEKPPKFHLSLPRQPVELLKSGASCPPLHDADILLGVDIEWFLVDGLMLGR